LHCITKEDDDESEPSSDGETEATHDTVMLEWSDKIPSLVRQLAVAE
jgi:hypothetical protein